MHRRSVTVGSLLAGVLGLATGALGQGATSPTDDDARTHYDVLAYRLDLLVDPAERTLQGVACMEAEALVDLTHVVLDCDRRLRVQGVSGVDGPIMDRYLSKVSPLTWTHEGYTLRIPLASPVSAGSTFAVAVQYTGTPQVQDDFTGFHWSRTPDGRPWIASSCQTIGSHTWWPCKSSFFHPGDKPNRVAVHVTVPNGLYAAANGRLVEVVEDGALKTFRWRHDYPQPTYSVAVAIGPYEVLESEVALDGCDAPVPLRYYVLPADVEKARREFAIVPELLAFYTERFGPYPFPNSKFALAQTPFWGMEHSTVISYGNSFPTWLADQGEEDVFAERNRLYDYILVHETAHEWWGNAITAGSWGDFWLHEGFATYAEALWVERQLGEEAYLDFMQSSRRGIPSDDSVFRPRHDSAAEAYATILYDKGAYVLHMLRYVMRDPQAPAATRDAKFFAAIKEFATDPKFRYGTATTSDFQRVCERHHGSRLRTFFQPWLYGTGWPRYQVEEKDPTEQLVTVVIRLKQRSLFPFRMPLDVVVHGRDQSIHPQRHWIEGEETTLKLEAPVAIARVEYPGFRWILCDVSFDP